MSKLFGRVCAGILILLSTACSAQVGETPAPEPALSSTPPSASTPASDKPAVDQEFLDYFLQAALYPVKGSEPHVLMWEKPEVVVGVESKISAANRKCVEQTVSDFNESARSTKLKVAKDPEADIKVFMVPAKTLREGNPQWAPGFYSFDSYTSGVIYGAQLYIRSTEATARAQCHSIRVQLTRAMGLMSGKGHSDSIFKQGGSATEYSNEDKRMIEVLYSGRIKPGDRKQAVTETVTIES